MIPFLCLSFYIGLTEYKAVTLKKGILYVLFNTLGVAFYFIDPLWLTFYTYGLMILLFVAQAKEDKNYLSMLCIIMGFIGLMILSIENPSITYIACCFTIGIQLHDSSLQHLFENNSTTFQTKLLKNQIDEVHNIYMQMRGWRHDYHNHLQSLKAKLAKNQIEEAKTYLNELEVDLDDIKQIVETGNVQIDAILNSKLSLALNQDIDLNVKVLIPEHLPFSEIDCCVILGNLIDNAIEACENVKDEKFIRLYIGLYKQQFYISITNSTTELVRKLDDEYITHKRGNHGHGLKRINKVVEKYNGFINRQNEPGIFVTEIMLPMNQTCTN